MNTLKAQPWYRQFWPWFLIALPATAVIASMYTIYLAVQNKPTMVKENYYLEGLSINERIHQDQRATELDMQANLLFSEATGKVNAFLSGKHPITETLILAISAPGDESLDRVYQLKAASDSLFISTLKDTPKGRFYVSLEPQSREWRLQGEITLPRQETLTLIHQGSEKPVTNE